jgi:hypothetical protein
MSPVFFVFRLKFNIFAKKGFCLRKMKYGRASRNLAAFSEISSRECLKSCFIEVAKEACDADNPLSLLS